MAVPSARNSGFETIWKFSPLSFACRTRERVWAVRTGRVLFSTTILSPSANSTISRAVFSRNCRSDAFPAPHPKVFVGVLTETKMMSAALIPAAMSVE